ncbi:MAG TPA: hypothetical protein VHR18_00270 [Solirubrobacterales bacterium]|jgi:beta-lactamase superfamily II metal-dependent hydrolase|nr:hypothetical protein [Solirubrobacterales bacterium]
MAPRPSHLRIRSYNVGFGDCFLLTFSYPGRSQPRSVLIDFGSTMQSSSGPDGGMLEIAEKIREDCEGKLRMLVATHRHADHISGFAGASGKVIASLEPDLVVQPWTEDPEIDPEATAPAGAGEGKQRARAMASRLSAMQSLAQMALSEVPRLEASGNITKTLATQIRFLGETNLMNAEAVKNLASMGSRNAYVNFGTPLSLERLLPGVEAEVLGPPTLEQSKAISHQAATDEDEFWHFAERDGNRARAGSGSPIFPKAPIARTYPETARWVVPRIDNLHAEEVLAIVRTLDGVLNNTSVILLFEVGGKLLLFPGDAQLENWKYALHGSKDAEAIRKRLADADFYKVGHHGSLNATPKSLWNEFKHRDDDAGDPGRLKTMVSTAAGKHGSDSRGTEVPRKVLIKELEGKSDLSNTQRLRSRKVFWNDVEFDFD